MARKVRNYPSKQNYEKLMQDALDLNRETILGHLLGRTKCSSVEELRQDDFNMRWGLDCGFVSIHTSNPIMQHEWELDNGKYSTGIYLRYPYETQSITLKKYQADMLLEMLQLTSLFYVETRLD